MNISKVDKRLSINLNKIMGPDNQAEAAQPLTPEQQRNLDVIDKLAAKNKELGGRLVTELGNGNNRFMVFNHAMDSQGEKLALLATMDGFKVIVPYDLSPKDNENPKRVDLAAGVVNYVQRYSEQNKDHQSWKYLNSNGRIVSGGGAYLTDRHPDSDRIARLEDAEIIGSQMIEDLIQHNRQEAVKVPEIQDETSVNAQISQNLDKLLD